MAEYDATEFIDTDFQAHKTPSPFAPANDPLRAPTRDEVDRKVVEAQQKLAELKRAQEDLERERASLEELRRRQLEFQNGRQEMVQNLTRGLGLLEEAEFNARRDSEQMLKTIADFRDAIEKIQNVRDETLDKGKFPDGTDPRAHDRRKRPHGMEFRAPETARARRRIRAEKIRGRIRAAASCFAVRQFEFWRTLQNRPGDDVAAFNCGFGCARCICRNPVAPVRNF